MIVLITLTNCENQSQEKYPFELHFGGKFVLNEFVEQSHKVLQNFRPSLSDRKSMPITYKFHIFNTLYFFRGSSSLFGEETSLLQKQPD